MGFKHNINLTEFFSSKHLNTLTPTIQKGRLIPKGFGCQGNSKCQQSNIIKKQTR
jgi:hypothetical protein